MSRDYARKGSAKPKSNARKNPTARAKKDDARLHFFFYGVFTTIAIQLAYHAYTNFDGKQEAAMEQPVVEQVAPVKKKNTRPDITFYQTLPDAQVQVDVKPVAVKQQKPYTGVLQAGSFKNINDAEQRRAEILLLGLEAKVESSENSSGTLWHRLIVGPFESRSALNKARNILENNGMETLPLTR